MKMLFIRLLAWLIWKLDASVMVNVVVFAGRLMPKMRKNSFALECDSDIGFHYWNRVRYCHVTCPQEKLADIVKRG